MNFDWEPYDILTLLTLPFPSIRGDETSNDSRDQHWRWNLHLRLRNNMHFNSAKFFLGSSSRVVTKFGTKVYKSSKGQELLLIQCEAR